ncbi:MAG: TauD/TfdA family dioxygenase [Planctomycetes bacterium]|nr:TauD/TfdA family dioxygenase [Planctomycetota bacterium]
MLNRPITGPRAWRAETIDAPHNWYYPLPDACLRVADQVVRDFRSQARPTTELWISPEVLRTCRAELAAVATALEHGRGFVIIEGAPLLGRTTEEAQTLYWVIGQLLGRPFQQNVQGTLLYDVRDTGQDVRYGARFSVTNAESSFHTDNSFGSELLDYVGLLCVNTAKAGGLNQVVSGYAVHNILLDEHPDVLQTLYQPFHVDRRGGVEQGESPTVEQPILSGDGRELVFRYLRYWIEAGHEKVGQPLMPAQTKALNVLDQLLNRRDLMAEFGLRRGEMFFINNRWILHNRTAFEDHSEPERRRHYVRLWLKADASGIPASLASAG